MKLGSRYTNVNDDVMYKNLLKYINRLCCLQIDILFKLG